MIRRLLLLTLCLLAACHFARRQLEGELPKEISEMRSLGYLNLHRNRLRGPIPKMPPNLFLLNLSRNRFEGEISPDLASCTQLNYLNLTENPRLKGKPAKALEGEATQEYISLLKRKAFFEFFDTGIKVAVKRLSSQQAEEASQGLSPAPAAPPPAPLFRFLAECADSWDNILSFFDPHYCHPTDRQSLLRCWTSLGRAPRHLCGGVAEDFRRWKGVEARGGRVVSICWKDMGLRGAIKPDLFNVMRCLESIDLRGNRIEGGQIELLGGCLSEVVIGNERRELALSFGGPSKRTAADEARENFRWTRRAQEGEDGVS